ncbi:MAG: NUDIX domain-containing protein [Nanoarchaeota archaeon]|nr:NUDIX domain-containing protein [Nanoarchaeota archaeon]
MPQEKSAGAIIYNKGKYLILHYQAGHWGFPKGNIEKDETEIQTVRREVEEETSIKDIFQVKGFSKKVSYFFKRQGKIVHKEVIYFLFESNTDKIKLSDEHLSAEWLSFYETYHKLTFKNSKKILRDAHSFLNPK